MAALACLVLGLGTAVSGADLRGKLPLIQRWEATGETLRDRKRELLDKYFAQALNPSDASLSKLREEDQAVEEQIRKHDDEEYTALLLISPRHFANSDSMLALAMYLALFTAAVCKRIIRFDPFFEYDRIAVTLAGLRRSRLLIGTMREVERRAHLDDVAEAETRLARARATLGIYAPQDPLSRPSRESEAVALAGEQAAQNEKYEARRKAAIVGWKAERLSRYLRWYLIFSGKRLDTREDSVAAGLEAPLFSGEAG